MSVFRRAFVLLNNSRKYLLNLRYFHPAIPSEPVVLEKKFEPVKVKLDSDLIEHLERLSLVDFANREGVRRLEEAIHFADIIHNVDTDNVKPLINITHEESLPTREDVVTEGNIREELLGLAALTVEGYYFAPPGNIPLEPKNQSYLED